MKHLTHALAASALILCAACADTSVTGPLPLADLVGPSAANPRGISMMSRNLYIGFGDEAIGALASGDPSIYVPALQAAAATLLRTDFPTRAGLIADEIARTRPHAVGLQEAWAIHADLTPLGGPQVDLDYLAILQAAIDARHLPYAVAAQLIDTDARPLPGIQLVDREAMLVDTSRVTVGAITAQTYANNIGPIAPGIDKKAGFIIVAATIGGMPVTLATTHLESDLGPDSHPLVAQLRYAQAAELAATIGAAPRVVLVGDLNDDAGSLMYQALTGAGLVDSWATLNPGDPGLTDTCFQPDLSDSAPHCQARIDFIFERGLEQPHAGLLGKEILVGLSPTERVQGAAGLIWPSDHAGVVGDFLTPPGRGPLAQR